MIKISSVKRYFTHGDNELQDVLRNATPKWIQPVPRQLCPYPAPVIEDTTAMGRT
jgi:hypothetical protein